METYVCNSTIVEPEIYYSTDGCGKPPLVCSCFQGYKDPRCLEHEDSIHMKTTCGIRPDQGGKWEKGKCAFPGGGKPDNTVKGWLSTADCSRWAQCMGYLFKGLSCQSPKF